MRNNAEVFGERSTWGFCYWKVGEIGKSIKYFSWEAFVLPSFVCECVWKTENLYSLMIQHEKRNFLEDLKYLVWKSAYEQCIVVIIALSYFIVSRDFPIRRHKILMEGPLLSGILKLKWKCQIFYEPSEVSFQDWIKSSILWTKGDKKIIFEIKLFFITKASIFTPEIVRL